MVDALFERARSDEVYTPYQLLFVVYHMVEEHPGDDKLRRLYEYLKPIIEAGDESRIDDLKKDGVENYVAIDDDTNVDTKLAALCSIQRHINSLMLDG